MVVNIRKLRVALFKVEPEDYCKYKSTPHQKDNNPAVCVTVGKKIKDYEFDTACVDDVACEVHIPLSPALDSDGLGHVVAFVTCELADMYGITNNNVSLWESV